MSSLEALRTRWYARKGKLVQVGTDLPVAIRLRYVGGGTVTSVTVTTGTNLVTVSVEGGVTHTKTYAFSTYATVGALVDVINADGLFQARVLDSLRSFATATQFVDGAITLSVLNDSTTIWDVLVDTSAAKYFAANLCVDRGFNEVWRGHRVNLMEAKYNITLGAAAANQFQIVERSYSPNSAMSLFLGAGIETVKEQLLSVSASAQTISWASGNAWISGNEAAELIVLVKDGTSIADSSANFLYVSGFAE